MRIIHDQCKKNSVKLRIIMITNQYLKDHTLSIFIHFSKVRKLH